MGASGGPSTLLLGLPQPACVCQAGHLSMSLQPFSVYCESPEQQPAWEIASHLPPPGPFSPMKEQK